MEVDGHGHGQRTFGLVWDVLTDLNDLGEKVNLAECQLVGERIELVSTTEMESDAAAHDVQETSCRDSLLTFAVVVTIGAFHEEFDLRECEHDVGDGLVGDLVDFHR